MRKTMCILLLLVGGNGFAQTISTYFKNTIAVPPPLPGLALIEYERFLSDYTDTTKRIAFSIGISTGFGYPTNVEFVQGIDRLFRDTVSFNVKWEYVFNPFIRFYLGSPAKKVRPVLMFKPSLFWFNIENEKTYLYPAYEIHGGLNWSFAKRFFFAASFGYKHFLKHGKIEYQGEETYFPEFKFRPDNANEKPKRWLPATDIAIGFRF